MPVSDVDLMLSLLSGRRTVNPSADRHRHTSQRPARYECETRDEDQNGSCGKVRASRKQRMATGKVFGPFLVVPHSTPTYGEARLLVGLSGSMLLHLPPEMTVDVPIIFLRQWRRSQQERSTAVAGIYRCQVIVLGVRGA